MNGLSQVTRRVTFAVHGGVATDGGALLHITPEDLGRALGDDIDLSQVVVSNMVINHMDNASPFVLTYHFNASMDILNGVYHEGKTILRMVSPFANVCTPFGGERSRTVATPEYTVDECLRLFKNTMTKVHDVDEFIVWKSAPFYSYLNLRYDHDQHRTRVRVPRKALAEGMREYLRYVHFIDLSMGITMGVDIVHADKDTATPPRTWPVCVEFTLFVDPLPTSPPGAPAVPSQPAPVGDTDTDHATSGDDSPPPSVTSRLPADTEL